MANKLAHKKCVPCEGGVEPLKGDKLKDYMKLLEDWTLVNDHQIEKEYKFKNFREALAFVNLVGQAAEKEGHHPDIFLTYGKVKITLWTHSIDGLSENDFILAAKCDEELHRVSSQPCY